MNITEGHSISEPHVIKREAGLLVGIATLVVFLLWGGDWLGALSGWAFPLVIFAWLFGSMLWLSFGVVHHADAPSARRRARAVGSRREWSR